MSASTITPKQQSFVRSLLQERTDVLNIDDLDAYIDEKKINEITARSASDLIDYLKSIPLAKKAEHSHLPEGRVIVNRFTKDCSLCGFSVEIGTGHAVQTNEGWQTFHAKDACPESEVVESYNTEVEPKKAYRCDDGTIAIAYLTQNKRLAVRRLVINEDGVGNLEYWKGGLNIVKRTGVLLSADEASQLGRLYGFCCVCVKPLSDDRSLAVGYGETCASNNGWFYPTKTEASVILSRPTTL